MRVPASALLPLHAALGRGSPAIPVLGIHPLTLPQDTVEACPDSHPEGHRAALPQAAARLFHPKPVPCRTQSEKKKKKTPATDTPK